MTPRMPSWRAASLAALAGLLLASPAGAQVAPDLGELSLDQLMTFRVDTVFSASKYEQKVTRAPASVTIVTREEIRRYGYRTLADVLRGVPGVYIGYDRNYSQIGVRGFARPGDFNTRMLLLLDGHRLNDGNYSAAVIGHDALVDVDLIERVEVIRGPGSSIYGSNAFFGVINIVTRQGGAVGGVEVAASAGRFGTYEGRATLGRKLSNGVEVLASASGFESAGHQRLYYPEFDTPQQNHGVAVGADAESTRTALGRVGYAGFTLTGAYSDWRKTNPTAAFGAAFNSDREKTSTEAALLDLSYSRELSADTTVTARAFYDHHRSRADIPFDSFFPPPAPRQIVMARADGQGDIAGAEAQGTTKLAGGHTLVFGGEYRKDLLVRQKTMLDAPINSSNETENQRGSVGLYAQAELRLLSNLLVNAGLRYDRYQSFGGTLSPRIGLIYGPAPSTTLKALYGRAYRAPNAYEMDLEAPGYQKLNPSLGPETIQTFELVAEQVLPGGLRVAGSAYRLEVDDLISERVDSDGLFVFRNADAARAHGVEVQLDGAFKGGLLFRASWAIQRTEDARTGDELENSPRHLLKMNASLPVYRDLVHAGLEAQLTSGLGTIRGNQTSRAFVVNTTLLGKTPLKGLEWSVSFYNLLDEEYSHPGSAAHVQDVIPQDGRSFRVKAAYRF